MAYGGEVIRAPEPRAWQARIHRTPRRNGFSRSQRPLFCGALSFLVVRGDTLPDALTVTAKPMVSSWGFRTSGFPSHGVQFHPESIASEHGLRIFENFLALAAQWNHNERRARLQLRLFASLTFLKAANGCVQAANRQGRTGSSLTEAEAKARSSLFSREVSPRPSSAAS